MKKQWSGYHGFLPNMRLWVWNDAYTVLIATYIQRWCVWWRYLCRRHWRPHKCSRLSSLHPPLRQTNAAEQSCSRGFHSHCYPAPSTLGSLEHTNHERTSMNFVKTCKNTWRLYKLVETRSMAAFVKFSQHSALFSISRQDPRRTFSQTLEIEIDLKIIEAKIPKIGVLVPIWLWKGTKTFHRVWMKKWLFLRLENLGNLTTFLEILTEDWQDFRL